VGDARCWCGYEEVGCCWVGSGDVVSGSWDERVSDGRLLVCVWAKCLLIPTRSCKAN